MPKPLLDSLEGISPAVAIEQKNPTTSSRSTVGTATEIYDYLRRLWARCGTTYCRNCGAIVKGDTQQGVEAALLSGGQHVGAVLVTLPLPASPHRADGDIAAHRRPAR